VLFSIHPMRWKIKMEESSKLNLDVNILGQQVRIKHDNEEYVRGLEKFLNEKIMDAQRQQNITTLQLAARVLLVLADEVFSLEKEQEKVKQIVEDKARQMIEFIDRKTVSK